MWLECSPASPGMWLLFGLIIPGDVVSMMPVPRGLGAFSLTLYARAACAGVMGCRRPPSPISRSTHMIGGTEVARWHRRETSSAGAPAAVLRMAGAYPAEARHARAAH